jgi:hypothetical protein
MEEKVLPACFSNFKEMERAATNRRVEVRTEGDSSRYFLATVTSDKKERKRTLPFAGNRASSEREERRSREGWEEGRSDVRA